MSSTTPEDDELKALLADSAEVRARYRASALDEPPAALDSAIRAAARREVQARPRLASSPFAGSWRVPLSIAAVVVVSVTVTLMVAEHTRYVPSAQEMTPIAASAPETSREQPEVVPAPPPEPAKKRADTVAAAPASPGATPLGSRDQRRDAGSDKQEKLALPTPPSPPEPAEGVDRYRQQAFPASTKPDAPPSSAPAPVTAKSTPSADLAGGLSSNMPEQRRLGPAEEHDKPMRLKDEDSAARLAKQAPAAAPSAESKAKESAAPGAAPEPPPPSAKSAEPGAAAGATPRAATVQQPESRILERNALRFSRQESESFDQLHGEAANAPWERDPQAWLERVKELQAAGRTEEAKASYKAFRIRYPDYRLPAGFVAPVP